MFHIFSAVASIECSSWFSCFQLYVSRLLFGIDLFDLINSFIILHSRDITYSHFNSNKQSNLGQSE